MTATTRHFSPRASLAAVGLRLRRLRLLETIANTVKVPQKTVRHTPAEKLYDAFLAILSGAHGLSEINTRLRADATLQRSFGRSTCAEYSLVQTPAPPRTSSSFGASSHPSSASTRAPPATTTPSPSRCSTST